MLPDLHLGTEVVLSHEPLVVVDEAVLALLDGLFLALNEVAENLEVLLLDLVQFLFDAEAIVYLLAVIVFRVEVGCKIHAHSVPPHHDVVIEVVKVWLFEVLACSLGLCLFILAVFGELFVGLIVDEREIALAILLDDLIQLVLNLIDRVFI